MLEQSSGSQNFRMHQNDLEGLLAKTLIAGLTLEFQIQLAWVGTQKLAFLTSFQEIRMLLVHRPRSENHQPSGPLPSGHRLLSHHPATVHVFKDSPVHTVCFPTLCLCFVSFMYSLIHRLSLLRML